MPKYPNITLALDLHGEGGNAWFIMARLDAALKKEGVLAKERDAIFYKAMDGDYDELLDTVKEYVNTTNGEEPDGRVLPGRYKRGAYPGGKNYDTKQ